MENLAMTPDFWKNKSVLITGHTGFKGSWLSLWLKHLGANVSGLSLPPPTTPSLFEIANLSPMLDTHIVDIRNGETVLDVIKQLNPDLIFHMAAQSLVRYSYLNPVETYATNVMGTVNVLEAARFSPSVRAIVNVTSDKCYDNLETQRGYIESDAMGGYDPYSSSKACAELVTSAYRNSFFSQRGNQPALASARAGNVIGGGDWAKDRLIKDIMTSFMENQSAVIRNPLATRPWQHVLEPLHGYLLLAEHLWSDAEQYAESWNFGPAAEDCRPVEWIVNYLVEKWDDNASYTIDSSEQPHEADMLHLNASKAVSRLGWHSLLPLEKSLDWTVEWFKAYQSGKDMCEFTIQQIDTYQSEAVS
jgi:CDP-glucose 4,6-dehydratase